MNKREINCKLKDVIKEARELNIPVPSNIYEDVFINNRPKKRFGCCKKQGRNFQIEISSIILNAAPKKIKEILAHEILHTCKDCNNHGDKWKKYAKLMNEKYGYNIKRTSSYEELGLVKGEDREKRQPKYIITCLGCGREYYRQKETVIIKKINHYKCRCGGRLTVRENKRK